MKRSRFSEEQTIGILRGAGGRCGDASTDQQCHLLQVEGTFDGMGWPALDRGCQERIRSRRSEWGLEAKRVKSRECSNSIALQSFRHACQKRTNEYQPSTSYRCREELPCTYLFVKVSASQAGRPACFVNRTGESLGKRKQTPRSAGPWKGLSNLRPFSFITLSSITSHEPPTCSRLERARVRRVTSNVNANI
jgi:hypothetical protein